MAIYYERTAYLTVERNNFPHHFPEMHPLLFILETILPLFFGNPIPLNSVIELVSGPSIVEESGHDFTCHKTLLTEKQVRIQVIFRDIH